jgi:hypothetical protein
VNARVLVVGLIAIAVLTVAGSLYFRSTVTPFEKSFSSVLSPDGRYKAVRFVVTRRSAPAYCDASVSIYLAAYPDSFAETEKSYVVYAAPCPTPADPANLPEVQWLGNDAVQIGYTPGPPATDASKLRRRVVDASRAVKVSYVERTAKTP